MVSGEARIPSQSQTSVVSLTSPPPPHPIRGDLCERASPGLPPHTGGPASFEICLCHQRALTESHIGGGASAEVMLSIKSLGKNSQCYGRRRKWKNDLRESGLKGKAI